MKAIHECSTVQLIRSATIKVSLGVPDRPDAG